MEVMLATGLSHFFLAEEIPLISKLAGVLGMVIICAISKARFGPQMISVYNL